jgi:adenylosuccinate synthase
MDKTGRNGIRVGDIELEDFKERYRALADKHEAMISFYDVNILRRVREKEFFESIEELKKLDFIDSEEYLHQAQKRVSQYYVKELKVLYWM